MVCNIFPLGNHHHTAPFLLFSQKYPSTQLVEFKGVLSMVLSLKKNKLSILWGEAHICLTPGYFSSIVLYVKYDKVVLLQWILMIKYIKLLRWKIRLHISFQVFIYQHNSYIMASKIVWLLTYSLLYGRRHQRTSWHTKHDQYTNSGLIE